MKKLVSFLAVLLLIFLSALLFGDNKELFGFLKTQVIQPKPTPFLPIIAMPEPIVIHQVQSVGEITLVDKETSATVQIPQENPALTILGFDVYRPPNSVATLYSFGIAKGGYDQTQIGVSVDTYKNTVTFTLPPPKIIVWKPDSAKSKLIFDDVFEYSFLTLGAINEETIRQLNILAEEANIQDACQREIFKEVNDRAQQFFDDWFGNVFDQVIVVTAEGECQ